MPKPKVGVIFLPGILGSPLVSKQNEMAWPVHQLANEKMLALSLSRLPLLEKIKLFVETDNVGNRFPFKTRILKAKLKNGQWENVATFYTDFLRQLMSGQQDLGFTPDVVVLNYNWMYPVQNLVSSIRRPLSNLWQDPTRGWDGFMFVTHSMGGIVAMDTATLFPKSTVKNKFLGIVRVACPVVGAPETAARLRRGIETHWDMSGAERVVAWMLGTTGWEFSLLAAHIPGLSSLLPMGISQDTVVNLIMSPYRDGAPPQTDKVYSPRRSWTYAHTNRDNIERWVKASFILASRHLQRRINSRYTALWSNKVQPVVLTGKKTVQALDRDGLPIKVEDKGDGTVPEAIQACLGMQPLIVPKPNIDHSDAFSDSETWPTIFQGMKGLSDSWQKSRGGTK